MDEIANYIESQFDELFDKIPCDCTDIVMNPNRSVFAYLRNGSVKQLEFNADPSVFIRSATMLAGLNSRNLNHSTPCLSATLPKRKYRIEVLVPPAVEGISISIRLQQPSFFSLQYLMENGMMKSSDCELMRKLVMDHKNIIISGETGSGKTTLLTALINEIDINERLVIIEEGTREIYQNHKNCVNILTDKDFFTGRMAVKSALRMNPDRIIYGESRDGESALETLKAWHTGHAGGLATLHAGSCNMIKKRFEDLLSEVCTGDMRSLIDDTIDAAIHIDFKENRRVVSEIKFFRKGGHT